MWANTSCSFRLKRPSASTSSTTCPIKQNSNRRLTSSTLEVKIDDALNTVWLSIDQMAELFGRDKSVIGKHVRACFKEGELKKESVWAKFAYTAKDGKNYHEPRVRKKQFTDAEVWSMIQAECSATNASEFQQLSRPYQKHVMYTIHESGVGPRQSSKQINNIYAQ